MTRPSRGSLQVEVLSPGARQFIAAGRLCWALPRMGPGVGRPQPAVVVLLPPAPWGRVPPARRGCLASAGPLLSTHLRRPSVADSFAWPLLPLGGAIGRCARMCGDLAPTAFPMPCRTTSQGRTEGYRSNAQTEGLSAISHQRQRSRSPRTRARFRGRSQSQGGGAGREAPRRA